MNQKEWYDYCIKEGSSGDMVFDILKDWKEDRLILLRDWEMGRIILVRQIKSLTGKIADAEKEISSLQDDLAYHWDCIEMGEL